MNDKRYWCRLQHVSDGYHSVRAYGNLSIHKTFNDAIDRACIPTSTKVLYLYRRGGWVTLLNNAMRGDIFCDELVRHFEFIGRMPRQEAIDMAEIILRMS